MQKLWQLKNPGKTPGTRPTQCDHEHNATDALTSTGSPGSAKRQVEEPVVKDDQPSNDLEWGRYRNGDHPALGRQVCPPSNDN
jgi:hypothetical protein